MRTLREGKVTWLVRRDRDRWHYPVSQQPVSIPVSHQPVSISVSHQPVSKSVSHQPVSIPVIHQPGISQSAYQWAISQSAIQWAISQSAYQWAISQSAYQWAISQSPGSIKKLKRQEKISKNAKAALRKIKKENAALKKTIKIRDKNLKNFFFKRPNEGNRKTNHKRDEMEKWHN